MASSRPGIAITASHHPHDRHIKLAEIARNQAEDSASSSRDQTDRKTDDHRNAAPVDGPGVDIPTVLVATEPILRRGGLEALTRVYEASVLSCYERRGNDQKDHEGQYQQSGSQVCVVPQGPEQGGAVLSTTVD